MSSWAPFRPEMKDNFVDLHSLLVVNIGTPTDDAWFDRLPRLDYDEVVTAI